MCTRAAPTALKVPCGCACAHVNMYVGVGCLSLQSSSWDPLGAPVVGASGPIARAAGNVYHSSLAFRKEVQVAAMLCRGVKMGRFALSRPVVRAAQTAAARSEGMRANQGHTGACACALHDVACWSGHLERLDVDVGRELHDRSYACAATAWVVPRPHSCSCDVHGCALRVCAYARACPGMRGPVSASLRKKLETGRAGRARLQAHHIPRDALICLIVA